jgi:hypothetical protein
MENIILVALFVVFAACMLALACGAVLQYRALDRKCSELLISIDQLGRLAMLAGMAYRNADAHTDEGPRVLAFALNQAMYRDAAARARYHAIWGQAWESVPGADGELYFPSAPTATESARTVVN